jgi:hypothetical protein
VADDQESRTALKVLKVRFLSRDYGIGMTAYAGLSRRLPWVEGGALWRRSMSAEALHFLTRRS